MDAIIPAGQANEFPVDARELHASLGRTEMFSHWISREMARHGLVEGEDFLPYTAESTGGRPRSEYRLTQNAAKRIQIAAKGEVGDAAREGAVKLHDHVEAVRTPTDDEIVAKALVIMAGRVKALADRVTELEPRAEIADRLTRAEGDMSLMDAGRRLGLGPRDFIARLACEGVLHGHRGERRPRADLLKLGYFVVRSVVIGMDDEGHDLLRGQTMVTAPGLAWLSGRYERRSMLPAKEVSQ